MNDSTTSPGSLNTERTGVMKEDPNDPQKDEGIA
jgi:hypothetical protein